MTLQLAYISLSLLMTIIIIVIGRIAIKRTFNESHTVRIKSLFLLTPILLWHVYIFMIAQTGILQDYSLPPKVPLLLVLPAFLFMGIFIFRNRNADWLQNIPKHWLIFFQTFRIILETIFVFSVAKGDLHPNMTIEGYNYDIIFAITAPFIGYWLMKGTNVAKRLTAWWNYLGLTVIASIIFVVITTVYFPEFYGSTTNLASKEFGMYPYLLVPGFLMPSAVFMHVLSLVQLRKEKEPVANKVINKLTYTKSNYTYVNHYGKK